MSASRNTSQRHPAIDMLVIAMPVVVTMVSYTLMQYVDGVMVAHIRPADDANVAAQGNAGFLAWLVISAAVGLVTVINTFVAQNLGAGKPERGAAYAWAGLWIGLIWSVMILPAAIFVPVFFEKMGHDPQLVELETGYARIALLGCFFTVAARSTANYFYGLHRPFIVMASVIVANIINVFANGVLIFGVDGPPAEWPFASAMAWVAQTYQIAPMGLEGAALGTLIGSFVDMVLPLAVFLSGPVNRKFNTRAGWRPDGKAITDVLRVGWPAGAMMVNEMICWGWLMLHLIPKAGMAAGEDPQSHNAAGWIALRYMHLSFMPAVGLSIAVTAIVGRCMGMRRPDLATRRAWLGLGVCLTYMLICAISFVIFREPLVRVFISDDLPPDEAARVLEVGASVLILAAIFQVFDAIAITLSGALRGAGDTFWPGVLTVTLSWTCTVGIGHLMIWLAPGLGSVGPWIGASLFIILLGLTLLWRFIGGRWREIDLIERASTEDVAPDPGELNPEAG